jgi:hypothetical protein
MGFLAIATKQLDVIWVYIVVQFLKSFAVSSTTDKA